MNFHQLLCLFPGIKKGVESWSFSTGQHSWAFKVDAHVIDDAPYTTTVAVEQQHENIHTPRIVIRLYHDVEMAEIVSWDNHRYWLPEYSYPNPQMYHPDEKLALNQFLGDWLTFCLDQGLDVKSVMRFT